MQHWFVVKELSHLWTNWVTWCNKEQQITSTLYIRAKMYAESATPANKF